MAPRRGNGSIDNPALKEAERTRDRIYGTQDARIADARKTWQQINANNTYAPSLADQRAADDKMLFQKSEQAKIKAYLENYRSNFIRKVEETAARNPNINPKVFEAIVDEYMAQQPGREADMLKAYKENPTPAHVKADIGLMHQKYNEKMRDKIYKDFGDEGLKGLEEVGRAMQPQSIFSPIIKMFYNSDKGGMQWGTTGGAILGLLLGSRMGGGEGGIMSFIVPVVAAVAMGFLGNRLFDSKPETVVTHDFHTKHKVKGVARGQTREVSTTNDMSTTVSQDAPATGLETQRPATNADFDRMLTDKDKIKLDGDARTMALGAQQKVEGPSIP